MKPSILARSVLLAALITSHALLASAQSAEEQTPGGHEEGPSSAPLPGGPAPAEQTSAPQPAPSVDEPGVAVEVSTPTDATGAEAGSMDLDLLTGCVDSFDCMFVAGEVVITGTRTVRPAGDAPVATQVITSSEIRTSGARNVAEVLTNVSGVNIRQSASSGGTSIEIQGIDARRVLVLLDGQRVAGRNNGVLDLARFPTQMIERIEIVRGAASALYGSDAIGGVVNLISRQADQDLQADATLRYGKTVGQAWNELGDAGDNWDLSTGMGFKQGPLQAYLSGGFSAADAFDLDPSDPGTNGSQRSDYHIDARGRFVPDGSLKLGARAGYRQSDLQGIDSSSTGAVYDRRTLDEEISVGLTPALDLAAGSWLQAGFSHSYWNHQYLRDQRQDTANDSFDRSIENLTEASLQYNLALHRASQMLTVGVDGLHQRLRSDRLEDGTGDRTRVSPFAQTEWTPLDAPYLAIVPGLRADLDTQYGVSISPKVSVRFDPHEDLVLRAGGGRGFRAPDFKQLLVRFENPTANYRVEGNAELKPEYSWSANIGAEWEFFEDTYLEANLYRNELRDLIIDEVLGIEMGTIVRTYQNVASAYTQGVESTLSYRFSKQVFAALGYTLTDAWDREKSRALTRRSLHRASFRLRYMGPGWLPTASLRASWAGRSPEYLDPDEDGEGGGEVLWVPAFTIVDLRVEQPVFEGCAVVAGIDNLLDQGNPDNPLRPRTIHAGLQGQY